jgi:hypothetical protein
VSVSPRKVTTTQYLRDGVVYRPVRDARAVDVHLIWHRQHQHPATQAALTLLTSPYQKT